MTIKGKMWRIRPAVTVDGISCLLDILASPLNYRYDPYVFFQNSQSIAGKVDWNLE